MDCIGAAAGVCAMARKKGAPVHIIKEAGQNPASEMSERLGGLGEYKDVFLSQQDAILLADANCLLVVVDTNRPEQVVSQDLLEAVHKVAVIDHHRRASSYIADAALNFHEPYASSASELVTELLQYLLEPADLLKTEAEALLAGMVLDTKQFTMRTGSRTFEAAAFLRRSGADTGDVKKLFQNDLEGTIAKYDIIQNAKMYHEGIAVAKVDHTVGRITAAQAADELLNISGIDTSFVLFPDQEGRVITLEYEGFYFVTVYTPNSQSELARLSYRMDWERDFLRYLEGLEEEKPVIFCGDLNVAHQEIDLKNPKTNRKNAGFTDEERACFTRVLQSGFIDTFRYFYPDQEGIYSWWSYRFRAREKNAGWRIDYFLVSPSLRDKLVDAKIHTQVMGSDHCPVELDISL